MRTVHVYRVVLFVKMLAKPIKVFVSETQLGGSRRQWKLISRGIGSWEAWVSFPRAQRILAQNVERSPVGDRWLTLPLLELLKSCQRLAGRRCCSWTDFWQLEVSQFDPVHHALNPEILDSRLLSLIRNFVVRKVPISGWCLSLLRPCLCGLTRAIAGWKS